MDEGVYPASKAKKLSDQTENGVRDSFHLGNCP